VIYERLDAATAIHQGDIFRGVPCVELPPLGEIPLVRDDGIKPASWQEVIESRAEAASCVAAIRPVYAVVLTQDCDAVRARDISLCEIGRFADVEPKSKDTVKPKRFASLITQHARVNQKWYYLPPDEDFGFTERMAADFRSILRVARTDLEQLREAHRIGKLKEVALEHFRERAADFYRRYAYDEWYPLSREEFEHYRSEKGGSVEPYPWQT